MKKNLIFDSNVIDYDRLRPKYVEEMYKKIFEYANINKDSKILEIGCGTGQATERFLKTGANLLAIEPGEKMASFCTEKFNENENFKIINTTFENAELGESQYDLVFSATAFHWVDEKIGYKKILDILKKNGAVALFWNKPFLNKKDDLLHVEIQKIYKKYRPLENEPIEIDYELYNKRKEKIENSGFECVEFNLFKGVREYSSENYIKLLNTYSDHMLTKPDIKEQFENEIKSVIEKNNNVIKIYDIIDLYLAKKTN